MTGSKGLGWFFAGLAAVATGAAAALLIEVSVWRVLVALGAGGWLVASRRFRLPEKRATGLLWLLAVAAASQATAVGLWRFSTSPWVRVWNVYHYYVGSKYFDELGYHDLYAATLRADREGDDYWRGIRRVRNLSSYATEPRSAEADLYQPEKHFSAERWQEFRSDVAALQQHRPARRWRGVFTDRGYNPSPLWTVVGGSLARIFPARSRLALKALCALDLALMAAAFWWTARVFGARPAAWALLLFTLTPVNEGRLVGGFLQYDWFCALAAGLAFLRRGRPLPAGALLAYATLTRVFPLLLVLSAGIPTVAEWIRTGGFRRRELAFFLAFTLSCGVGFGAGCLTSSGWRAWADFAGNLGYHASEHVYGERRIGLKHVFTHDLASLDFDESPSERRESFARQEGVYVVVAGIFVLIGAAAVLRRSVPDALLLGLVPLFALAVSSRYYWSCLSLLPLLARAGPSGRSRMEWLTLGQAALYGLYSLYELYRSEPYAAYSVFNFLLALFLAGLLALYLRRDLRVVRRARAAGSPPSEMER